MSSLSQSLSGCDSDSAPRASMASGSELQASEPLAASLLKEQQVSGRRNGNI